MSTKIPPGPNTVKGIDVSHHQSALDWNAVKADGVEFAILKASEGASFRDSVFNDHYKGAKAAGLMTGAYHFFRFSQDPIDQVNNFLTQLKSVPVDLPPVIDFEWADGKDSVTQAMSDAGLKFLTNLENIWGVTPMVYTANGFFTGNFDRSPWARYPLWVAHYTSLGPVIPAPWKNWKIWQYSDKGHMPGSTDAHIDMNYFNGTLPQLKAFASGKTEVVHGLSFTQDAVEGFQKAVNGLGYTPMLKEDGILGPKTKAAAAYVSVEIQKI